MDNIFCIDCGFELPSTAKFCKKCGVQIGSKSADKSNKVGIENFKVSADKSNKGGIENFKVLAKKRKKRGTGFLEFIIILIIAFGGGAIGGFFGGMAFGGMGAAVGGIGSWILGRIIAYPIIRLVFPDRFEPEIVEDVEDEAKTKADDEGGGKTKRLGLNGCFWFILIPLIITIGFFVS